MNTRTIWFDFRKACSTKIKRRTSVRLFIYPRPKGLAWHQFAVRIVWNCGSSAYGISRQAVFPRSPFTLDSIHSFGMVPCSPRRDSIPQRVADYIHGSAVIKYESEKYCPKCKILDARQSNLKNRTGFRFVFSMNCPRRLVGDISLYLIILFIYPNSNMNSQYLHENFSIVNFVC